MTAEEMREVAAPDWEGFGRAVMDFWPESAPDGFDLHVLAIKHRILTEVPGGFDPERHSDATGSAESGVQWYERNYPAIRAIQIPEPTEDDVERCAEITRLRDCVEELEGALTGMVHAVCGEDGFAECVRRDIGAAYPWPALEIAEDTARALLARWA